ncbi:hypothetical protein [Fodinibius sp. SL11]|uniref:hypothetical protein n=1 Tax=Fodinibius sp. SL11 TaxID=3425690 RepID=UPI003F8804A5
MNLKKISYLLLVLIVGCTSLNHESYEGKKIEINYLHKDGFIEGDWIEIDGFKFTHLERMNNVMDNNYAVPTSEVIKDSLGPEKVFKSDFNSLSIAIMLANKLEKRSESDQDSSENLLITNKPLLMTNGKLRIMKKDSTIFRVQTSKNYPAEIEVLEM